MRKARELTESEQRHVLETIQEHIDNSKLPDVVCQICGHTEWNIMTGVYSVGALEQKGAVSPLNQIPVIPVICSTCGNTLLMSAKTLGIRFNDKMEGLRQEPTSESSVAEDG